VGPEAAGVNGFALPVSNAARRLAGQILDA